jgi:hypothetical protein
MFFISKVNHFSKYYFHSSAPFLWAYNRPMKRMKKNIMISTRATQPTFSPQPRDKGNKLYIEIKI